MQINRCPKCFLEPELAAGFKYDKNIDKMRIVGWRYSCPYCGLHTEVLFRWQKEAAAKWNEMTKG